MAEWIVVTSGKDTGICYADVMSADSFEYSSASLLWKRFNEAGTYSVLHVLKIGLPVVLTAQ